jgi:hypothetical protein
MDSCGPLNSLSLREREGMERKIFNNTVKILYIDIWINGQTEKFFVKG